MERKIKWKLKQQDYVTDVIGGRNIERPEGNHVWNAVPVAQFTAVICIAQYSRL